MSSEVAKRKSASQQPQSNPRRNDGTIGNVGQVKGGAGRQGKAPKPPAPPTSAAQAVAENDNPTIIPSHKRNETVAEALPALARDQNLYQRGGYLVEMMRESAPAAGKRRRPKPRIRAVPRPVLELKLCEYIEWRSRNVSASASSNGVEEKPIAPPSWVSGALHALGNWPGVPHLAGVADFPLWLGSGKILSQKGYDPESELLQDYDGGELELPPNPTWEDARKALEYILHFVQDFPFASEIHKAAWVAALLTMFTRYSFDGPAPLILSDGNTSGAGKGKLLNVIAVIATGKIFTVTPYPQEKGEFDKTLTSVALGGNLWVCFDNLEDKLGNASLDAILTNNNWMCRKLGTNEQVDEVVYTTFFATGNNVQLKGDIGRRILHIRLNSPHENPQDRTDFTYEDLEGAVLANRKKLLEAVFTILLAYEVAGRPKQELLSWGSYAPWSEEVRAPVVWLGMEDPAKTHREMRQNSDPQALNMAALLEYWEQCQHGKRGLTAKEFYDEICTKPTYKMRGEDYAAARDVLEGLMREVTPRALGSLIQKHRDRNYGGRMFQPGPREHNTATWYAASIDRFSQRPELIPQSPPNGEQEGGLGGLGEQYDPSENPWA